MGERPDVLLARFDRYLEAVLAQSGGRIETARAHLDAGFERMGEALVQAGSLEERGLDRTVRCARSRRSGRTQRARLVVCVSAERGRPVRRGTSGPFNLGRIAVCAARSTTSISTTPSGFNFEKVARVSGFAPRYFSRLFKDRQKRTYEHYVLGLRIERAKHLLSSTSFDVARVAKLSGFSSSQVSVLCSVREVGKSPLQFRRLRVYPSWRPGDDRPGLMYLLTPSRGLGPEGAGHERILDRYSPRTTLRATKRGTMKVIVLTEYGGTDKLLFRDQPEPEPGVDEVDKFRVTSASINPIDWKLRSGKAKAIMPLAFPAILGRDAAGEVVAVGPGVNAFSLGDRVMGLVRGAYAEFVVAPTEAWAKLAEGLDTKDAGALPLALLTGDEAGQQCDARR